MIKRYRVVDETRGIEVTLDIDHAVLTPALATEINAFWTSADWRLERADGDAVVAAIRLAAQSFIFLLLADIPGNAYQAMCQLRVLEGWPRNSGVVLVDFDGLPDIESTDLELHEVAR